MKGPAARASSVSARAAPRPGSSTQPPHCGARNRRDLLDRLGQRKLRPRKPERTGHRDLVDGHRGDPLWSPAESEAFASLAGARCADGSARVLDAGVALWTASAQKTFDEFNRLTLYAGVFVIACVIVSRTALGRWIDGLAVALSLVAGVALVSRLFPGSFQTRDLETPCRRPSHD